MHGGAVIGQVIIVGSHQSQLLLLSLLCRALILFREHVATSQHPNHKSPASGSDLHNDLLPWQKRNETHKSLGMIFEPVKTGTYFLSPKQQIIVQVNLGWKGSLLQMQAESSGKRKLEKLPQNWEKMELKFPPRSPKVLPSRKTNTTFHLQTSPPK